MFREILQLLNKDNLQVQALSHCHEMPTLCEKMVFPAAGERPGSRWTSTRRTRR